MFTHEDNHGSHAWSFWMLVLQNKSESLRAHFKQFLKRITSHSFVIGTYGILMGSSDMRQLILSEKVNVVECYSAHDET
ncbi:hypothetical protein SAMN05216419_100174 [Nitrosomonas cryotolerans]|uniref:Uncharacterized protein n=1 Tax=Nitrosomonas cryotolerans ATCC 49181 TaxID=1131553 RepID=A0A1N6IQJ9_9PROT|nr:hypothetical protein SAMN05216419_100174 [Nitrosomonas cryotolerans]SIO34245.1 hypothetical protein SAMN02743940_1991 [Nitrosomonas cryotolerans ATCC 49181]